MRFAETGQQAGSPTCIGSCEKAREITELIENHRRTRACCRVRRTRFVEEVIAVSSEHHNDLINLCGVCELCSSEKLLGSQPSDRAMPMNPRGQLPPKAARGSTGIPEPTSEFWIALGVIGINMGRKRVQIGLARTINDGMVV